MLVSCICVCHNKPDLTPEAIGSILQQSHPHWQAIVVDSGVLYDAGYYDRFAWRRDPRVTLIRSEETEEIRRTKAMAPWCYNECLRKGLVKGELIMYLCDDDILYPNAFATFVSYCGENPDALAMYASQDMAVIYPNGWRAIVGERRATRPGGRCCNGRPMDCHVDYLQFCHRASILEWFADRKCWPEEKGSETHADGILMERVGERTPIHPIDVKVSQNRRTLQSSYDPVRSFRLVECLANGGPLLPAGDDTLRKPNAALPLVTVSIAFHSPSDGLADTLASVAGQTYSHLEVLVIDGCSVAEESAKLVEEMQSRYASFRFLRPSGAGNDPTRDRGLWEAAGDYFISMDGDTVACPEMVERLVAAMRGNPNRSALTCYLLAYREASSSPSKDGADLLTSTKNIYPGGIFDTAKFRQVGGYGTGRELFGQEWIGFVNLVNHGYAVDMVPEHLFYCRPGEKGARKPEPALRPFFPMDRELAAERVALWTGFAAMQQRLEQLAEQNRLLREQNEAFEIRAAALRHQLADRLTTFSTRVPFAKRVIGWLLRRLSYGSTMK